MSISVRTFQSLSVFHHSDLIRHEGKHLKDRLSSPLAKNSTLIIPKSDPPNRLARLRQLSDKVARPDIPELDPSVVAARDDESIVKLQTGDRIIVSADPLQAGIVDQIEDDHSSVGTAGDEGVTGELKLTDQGGVTLKQGDAFTKKERTRSEL